MGLFRKKNRILEPNNARLSSEINFDQLVSKARNSGEIEDLNALYLAFFDLLEWNFIVSNNSSMDDAKPFIGVVDDKPWLFVFTDGKKADEYAKAFGSFLEQDGNTIILKMTAVSSQDMLKTLGERGVFGLRINEGDNGWFIDVPGFFNIKSHLNK